MWSRFGEIVDINMPRDKEAHKPKGFSFLMYEDQRSTVLAVDNFNGAKLLGRTLRVDHVRSYKHPDKTNAEGERVEVEEPTYNAMPPVLSGEFEFERGTSINVVREADAFDVAHYVRLRRVV